MPIAYKIYKCQNCFEPIFEPFFDFQEIHSSNKFIHNCYSIQLQQKHQNNDINNNIETLNLQELLLSIINIRLKSEDKLLLKMIVFSDNLIENALALKILIDLIDNIGTEKDQARWLFELVENEGFVDLGEISSDHWMKRAYDCSSTEEKVTKLEKEELKQFLSITEGTFGLFKFRIDKKTIYTFCYLPFDNTKTIRQDGEDKGVISFDRFSEFAEQTVKVATEKEEIQKTKPVDQSITLIDEQQVGRNSKDVNEEGIEQYIQYLATDPFMRQIIDSKQPIYSIFCNNRKID
ncbi:MAG TPA: hypothetical protein VFK40_02680 [Nitrososphaeraceae archaeon]|nr:hypothetical protein [Nitrososphaeraceae archaeon]